MESAAATRNPGSEHRKGAARTHRLEPVIDLSSLFICGRAADQFSVLLFVGAPEDFESLAGRRVNAKSTDRSVERMLGKVTTLAGSHQYRKLRIIVAAYMTCSGYGLTSLWVTQPVMAESGMSLPSVRLMNSSRSREAPETYPVLPHPDAVAVI
jgi:hypothetical protein